MSESRQSLRSLSATLAALPPEWPEDPLPMIRSELARTGRKVVVLDDDPTGTQTVHDVAVVTNWAEKTLAAELSSDAPGFYILTNSRSLARNDTAALHTELAKNLRAAADRAGVNFSLISRSDSTLRGHFPLETDTLAQTLGPFHAMLLMPYFEAGERYTLDGVHYVGTNDRLVPAADTPFARDATFGYRHSDLREWVEEKTAGRMRASDVVTVPLAVIRERGPAGVAEILGSCPTGGICVADAMSRRDCEVVALAAMQVEASGKKLLHRTAASFVASRLGLEPKALLTSVDFKDLKGPCGGLVVVGSYVPQTTAQLRVLRHEVKHQVLELSVAEILSPVRRKKIIAEAIVLLNRLLEHGHVVLLQTSREVVTGKTPEESLAIVNQVSSALVEVVRSLVLRPRFLIAKGGITSSDTATRALRVRRAVVLGQLLPGVPVWRLGTEALFPDLDYVIFPGNVGSESALADAVAKLSA